MHSADLEVSLHGHARIVVDRLEWIHRHRIWPNGRRRLLGDAFGLVLLTSLYHESGDESYLDEARRVVGLVDRVLGRRLGILSEEAGETTEQDFRHLALWIYALGRLGAWDRKYRDRALHLVREIHSSFVEPRRGVYRKMTEDLSGPSGDAGYGGLEPYYGYVAYRVVGEKDLLAEIGELRDLIAVASVDLDAEPDANLGMMLWLSHFYPEEPWARELRTRALHGLDSLWRPGKGRFDAGGGTPDDEQQLNHLAVLGLLAVRRHLDRVQIIRSDVERGPEALSTHDSATHLMACAACLPGEWIRY